MAWAVSNPSLPKFEAQNSKGTMIETKASCADIRVIAIGIFIFGFVSSFDIQILNFRISGGSESPPERHHIHQSGDQCSGNIPIPECIAQSSKAYYY
jgi:hypothetical protein